MRGGVAAAGVVEAGWQAGDEGRPPYKLLLSERPGEPQDPEDEALYVRPPLAPDQHERPSLLGLRALQTGRAPERVFPHTAAAAAASGVATATLRALLPVIRL